MANGITVEVKGTKAMAAKLAALGVNSQQPMRQAMNALTNEVKNLSVRNCPKAAGTLRASHRAVPAEWKGGQWQGRVEVGGPTAPYALTVHEHPSAHDPPSWKGKKITFSNGAPKFLQRAIETWRPQADQYVGDRLKEILK